MSDALISASEGLDPTLLERAGWSNAELIWEQIQESAGECVEQGEIEEAAELWQGALEVARGHFAGDDPRVATSLVNVALARADPGLLGEALAVWDSAAAWVAALKPEACSRSSTFHLRMERSYPGGYRHFSQARYAGLAAEGRAVICRHLAGQGEDENRLKNRLARWRREKPAGFNDARKLLAAVLLMGGSRA